jgi:hypothetical protein
MVERYRSALGSRPFLIVSPCTFSNANGLRGEVLDRYGALYTEGEIRHAGGQGLIPDVKRRLDWDEAGLLAILEDLRATFPVAPRVHLTGFSGGGLLVYRMIIRHPGLLAVAVPVCPNFNPWGHGYRDEPGPPPLAAALPVHVMLGADDPLRWYRLGGDFLPSPPRAMGLVICWGALLAGLEWKRAKRRPRVAAIVLLGLALLGAVEAGRWSGNEGQTDAALRLLHDLGYTNLSRSTEPGLGHDPAPERVVRVIDEGGG